jgi:hypothetical protein
MLPARAPAGIRASAEGLAENPQARSGAAPMTAGRSVAMLGQMSAREEHARRSYAVIWRSGDGPVRPGKLVLAPASLQVETGAPSGRLSALRIRYADVASVEKAAPGERLRGRPTTLVRRREREPLASATLDEPGSAHELMERLTRALPGRDAA